MPQVCPVTFFLFRSYYRELYLIIQAVTTLMKRLRWTVFFALSPCILTFFSSLSFGQQWKPVLNIHAVDRGFKSGFFFDEITGLVASSADVGIFKTTNGGKTWAKANIPSGYTGDI